jgi:uncharacterized membrane-anchored protein YjiN (DUF445 family)
MIRFLVFVSIILTLSTLKASDEQKRPDDLFSRPFFQRLGRFYQKKTPAFLKKMLTRKREQFNRNPMLFLTITSTGLLGGRYVKQRFPALIDRTIERNPHGITSNILKNTRKLTELTISKFPKKGIELASDIIPKAPWAKQGLWGFKRMLKAMFRAMRRIPII